jgi:hypothetical protein
MQLRLLARTISASAALVFGIAAGAPAFAHGDAGPPPPPPGPPPGWQAPAAAPGYGPAPEARMAWLNECRQRTARRDDGIGGAVIGGVVGGIAGNRIAGRHHRTLGTVAGAAVGAVAGAAIDRAEDNGRIRDECERYFDDYYAYYAAHARAPAYGQPMYGYGCCQPMAMLPARPAPECREEVRYVTEYVTVPGRRIIPRRPAPDKRVRIVPDKRVRVN